MTSLFQKQFHHKRHGNIVSTVRIFMQRFLESEIEYNRMMVEVIGVRTKLPRMHGTRDKEMYVSRKEEITMIMHGRRRVWLERSQLAQLPVLAYSRDPTCHPTSGVCKCECVYNT